MLPDRCMSCLSVCPVCGVGVLWPSSWMDQDETWHAGRPRSCPHCLDGDPAAAPQKGQSLKFSYHICWCQIAGWIKTALGMEMGLCPGHILLDEEPAPPPQNGAQSLIFGPFLLWLNGWMHQDATWYGGRPHPRPHCAKWGPSYPPKKRGGAHPPQCSAHL